MQSKRTMILLAWVYWFDFARFYKTKCTTQLLCFLVISKSMDVGGSQSKREWVCQVKRGVSERQPVRTHFSDFLFFPHRGFVLHPTAHRDNLIPAWFGGISLTLLRSAPAEPPQNQFDIKKAPIPLSVFSRHAFKSHRQSFSLWFTAVFWFPPHHLYK